jgi:hypothetical protein
LQINHSLHDAAEIIGIFDDLMELERVLVRVAADSPSIRMTRILGELIQANSVPA